MKRHRTDIRKICCILLVSCRFLAKHLLQDLQSLNYVYLKNDTTIWYSFLDLPNTSYQTRFSISLSPFRCLDVSRVPIWAFLLTGILG